MLNQRSCHGFVSWSRRNQSIANLLTYNPPSQLQPAVLSTSEESFYFFSAIPAIGAMIYVEVKLDNIWKELSDRNECWSYMLAWIGTGFLFFSAVFSFRLMCMNPRVGYTINYVPSKRTTLAKTNIAFDRELGVDVPIQTILVKKGKPIRTMESTT